LQGEKRAFAESSPQKRIPLAVCNISDFSFMERNPHCTAAEHRPESALTYPGGLRDGVLSEPIAAGTQATHLISPDSLRLAAGPAFNTASRNHIIFPALSQQFSFPTTGNPFAFPTDLELQTFFSSRAFPLHPPVTRPRRAYSHNYVSAGMAGEQLIFQEQSLSQSPSDRGDGAGSTLVSTEPGKSEAVDDVDSKTPLMSSPNLKKRSLSGEVEYPRRRAIIAVSLSLAFLKHHQT